MSIAAKANKRVKEITQGELPKLEEVTSSQIYDSEGRLAGSITKDAKGNIIYKPRQLTEAELTQKKGVEATRQSLLQRLYSTPQEYTQAAQTEADAWAKLQNQAAQEQFGKDVNKIGEVSNARGLLGSSAWRDILREREKTQAQTTSNIAGQATAMREDLIGRKKAQDYNLYNLYSGAYGQYGQDAANMTGQTQGLYGMQAGLNQQKYATDSGNYWNQKNYEMAQEQANEPWRNYIIPGATAAGLLFSDRRLKVNIEPIFKVGDVQWYQFDYSTPEGVEVTVPKGKHIGVMADEVKHLGVVVDGPFGYDMVDYEALRRHLKMEKS